MARITRLQEIFKINNNLEFESQEIKEKNEKLNNKILSKEKSRDLIKEYIEQNNIFSYLANDSNTWIWEEALNGVSRTSELSENYSLKLYRNLTLAKNKEENKEKLIKFFDTNDWLTQIELEKPMWFSDYEKYYSQIPTFEMIEKNFSEIFTGLDEFSNFNSKYEWMNKYIQNVNATMNFVYNGDYSEEDFFLNHEYSGTGNYIFGNYDYVELNALHAAGLVAQYFMLIIGKENSNYIDYNLMEEYLTTRCGWYGDFLVSLIERGFRKHSYPINYADRKFVFFNISKDEYLWLQDYTDKLEKETNGDFLKSALSYGPSIDSDCYWYNFIATYYLGELSVQWLMDTSDHINAYNKYKTKLVEDFFSKCPSRKKYFDALDKKFGIYNPEEHTEKENTAILNELNNSKNGIFKRIFRH